MVVGGGGSGSDGSDGKAQLPLLKHLVCVPAVFTLMLTDTDEDDDAGICCRKEDRVWLL